MKFFGYDIYLSKNIEKEDIEKLIVENYPEKQFIYTNFMDKQSDAIAEHTEEYAYFYIHQQQYILNSQFPFRLQIEGLSDEPNKWEKAYTLVEKICTSFKIYCFIEYPLNTENPSPYDVLLYMSDGEIHLASDEDYAENGVIYLTSIFKDSTQKKQ